ncbi:MAG: VIT1/CCC1 transporter family protein [Clostridia bacterium]
MPQSQISQQSLTIIRKMQQNEITESATYQAIAASVKDKHNQDVLLHLAHEEETHAKIWQKYSGLELRPQKYKVFLRKLSTVIMGFTFTIKRMEKGEGLAQQTYALLAQEVPESILISAQENEHEQALMEMLDEERLQYVGSMVLGLNDALVELTGALAGITFALQNTRLVALSGLITGIAATLSMASSEFLSAKSDGRKDALKSCTYTGVAYLITVALLILPYLLFSNDNYVWALVSMLAIVVCIIAFFSYYISVAKDLPFLRRFCEMAVISLGVAVIAFVIGLIAKQLLGIDV